MITIINDDSALIFLNLQVELAATNSEGCIFKILPRYKVRSVGDKVCYNDQAKFESIRTEGQFLHCSSRRYGNKFPVLEQWFVHIELYIYEY